MIEEKSCGTIIVDKGKVLLVKQKKSGAFNFPKGHMDDSETEIETAIRETKEETNLDVEVDSSKRFEMSFIQSEGINKVVVYYIATLNSCCIKKQESEISDIIWVEIDKVEDLLVFDNLKNLWFNVYNVLKQDK